MIDSLSEDGAASHAAHLIERLARLQRADDHAAGLNPAQWEALRFLARSNRFSSNPAALAAYLGATRGTVSQTLIALEAKGLIAKETDPRDRRSQRLQLTEAGRARLDADGAAAIAAAIAATGRGEELAALLEEALRAALDRRGGRAFGACRLCRHFERNAASGPAPHRCGLLNEPLSDADADAICIEHETAA